MSLKLIKSKIIATKKTGQVTKAMESVSAVKMRKSQERAFAGRPYISSAMTILGQLVGTKEGIEHPLANANDATKSLLVIVTSDKGLAGSVNSAILKKAETIIAKHADTEVIAIGRKALEFARREKLTVVGEFINVGDDVAVADVYTSAEQAIDGFTAGTYGSVQILYQNFLSTFEQAPKVRTVLPLQASEISSLVEDIKPKKGKFSDITTATAATDVPYTIEPSVGEVLDVLIPQLVQIMFYHALLESKASEHSARMVAMKNATDKTKEVTKALTLKFNKARQAAITAEVSEISGGIEAMK